jgi:transposase InsO family protein
VEQTRAEFVDEVKAGEKSKARICREYGISRVTGDKWLRRAAEGAGFGNQSRIPKNIPGRITAEIEKTIVWARNEHPAWGARKLSKWLENRGITGLPANSTICAVLKRNGLVSEAASRAATPYKRFEREAPNDLWQADFKGHFPMKDGVRCHPLTVIDDHSRFALCVDAKDNEKYGGVRESFERMFREYGLPKSLLCDNGNPWGTSQSVGITRFEVFLMDNDVLPIHGRPLHPQTQGKDERFNRTLKDEAITTDIENLTDAQRRFDAFRKCYNTERPHAALHNQVPASRYRESDRRFAGTPREWDYPEGAELRKIKSSGYLTIAGQGYFLSEALAELTVHVLEPDPDGVVNLHYRGFKVAAVDSNERCVISRKIRRSKD